jgi:hypothetical protein
MFLHHIHGALRWTSARCQIPFLLFWLDRSQRLHWEVDNLLVSRYARGDLALVTVPFGDLRHISQLWILRDEMQGYRHRWFSADRTGPVCRSSWRQYRANSRFIRDASGGAEDDIRHRGTLRLVMN